ncbi:MAG: hypothetical protein F4058_07115 [Rhodothermaceae bacterium]|nr:hypothetical protein [Rhodothermaceae bacterium]MYI85091.1 hypothetical protein [Rhodothermaceae bacterium]
MHGTFRTDTFCLSLPELDMTALNRCSQVLLVALMVLGAACGGQPPAEPVATVLPGEEFVTLDTTGAVVVTSAPLSSDATCTISEEPTLVIGDNEDDDNQWFSVIRGTGRLSDGSIVVADHSAAEVRIYDRQGRHLRSMGRSGEGPGEFRQPLGVWVTSGDVIWAGDFRPWRYNVFAAEGELVRQVNLNPVYLNSSRGGGVLDNGFTVNARHGWGTKRDFSERMSLLVEVHDPSGNLTDGPLRMLGPREGTIRGGPSTLVTRELFGSRPEIDALGSTIALVHGSKPEVLLLDQKLGVKMIMRYDDPGQYVTDAHVRAWRDNLRERRGDGWDEYDDAAISPDRPVADMFPYISTVKIGRDGRIWVKRYNLPSEERGWLAFGGDGRFVCHLAGMPGYLWEIGADYVLLESEEGTPTVRMHELKLPS